MGATPAPSSPLSRLTFPASIHSHPIRSFQHTQKLGLGEANHSFLTSSHHHRVDACSSQSVLWMPKRISSFQGCPLHYPLSSRGPEAHFRAGQHLPLGPWILLLLFSLSLRVESNESTGGRWAREVSVSQLGAVGCGERRDRSCSRPSLGWGQGVPAHSDLWGTGSEGKRKHGFAALGSGLPEGGAPVFCFPLGARLYIHPWRRVRGYRTRDSGNGSVPGFWTQRTRP